MALHRAVCRPRDAKYTVLQVVAEHLEIFLRAAAEAGDGAGRPQFVECEFREFLTCGVFEDGVARFRCEGCAREHLVPFSCKRRGFCPSCGGRRMTERAAHLVDAVLPRVPVRQWVLTVPYRLRYRLTWDHGLSRAVLRLYARAARLADTRRSVNELYSPTDAGIRQTDNSASLHRCAIWHEHCSAMSVWARNVVTIDTRGRPTKHGDRHGRFS